MLKHHEIEILLKAGHPRGSVKRIAGEGPVVHVDDTAERAKRQIGRPTASRISGNG